MKTDQAGRSPLHYAAKEDDAETVATLIRGGADPDVRDGYGFSPLHFAAQEGSARAARTLLELGASVDSANMFGNTPLWVAAFWSRGRGDLIELLLEHGADPRHANKAGQTPIGLAQQIANYDVARYFADAERRPRSGPTT
ncbi:MAG: ankyrin repeat domain-containing protein [Chloroflexota bacterium]|nr:ankyrin repeat domain-containing protein [Chloroflexota bacterium]